MAALSYPAPGARLGITECPGVDIRGHGLTMSVIHAGTCCEAWADAHPEAAAEHDLGITRDPEPEAELEAGI